MVPWVDREIKATLKYINEALWGHHKCPFYKFVENAARAQGRGVRRSS
jgi:hypothetical protein